MIHAMRRLMTLCEAAVPLDKDRNPLIDMDDRPIATNRDGTVTLYHRTSEAAAIQIKRTGRFTSRENTQEVFFSNIPDGQAASFGDYVVEVKVHPNKTRQTDALHGEMYLAVPTKYLSARNIVGIYAAPDDDQTLGEDADGDAEWQAILARTARIRQEALAYAKAGKPAKFRAGHLTYLVSKDLVNPPDGWRVTTFGQDGQPMGHWETKNAYDAFREVLAGDKERIGPNHIASE